MKTSKKFFHLWVMVAWAVLLSVPVSLAHPQTALAATKLDGYTLSVSESYSSFEAGSRAPQIVATLTVPADSTDRVLTTTAMQQYFYITIDSSEVAGEANSTSTADTYAYIIPSGIWKLSVGTHTVQAVFHSTSQNATITSDPITLTVDKVTPTSLNCSLQSGIFYKANSSFTSVVSLGIDPNVVTDYATATYTIAFVGPQNTTEANLKQQSGNVTFTFPSVAGTYQYTLTYNGTALSNPKSTSGSIKVTAAHPVTLALSSNPTTTTAGATVTYDVAVTSAGSPTPSGTVELIFGNSFTKGLPLDSNGNLLLQVKVPSPLATTQILVVYLGNSTYEQTQVAFPLTNPAISNTGTSPTTATATPASPSATGTPAHPSTTATPTSSSATSPGTPTVTAPSSAATTGTSTTTVANVASAAHATAPLTETASASSPFAGRTGGLLLGIGGPFLLISAGAAGFWAWRKSKKQRSQQPPFWP